MVGQNKTVAYKLFDYTIITMAISKLVTSEVKQNNRFLKNIGDDYHANKPGPIPVEEDGDQALLDAMKKSIESIQAPEGLLEDILNMKDRDRR